jgi:hypothetical protein
MIKLSEPYRMATKDIIQSKESNYAAYLRLDGLIQAIVYDMRTPCVDLKISQKLRAKYLRSI